MTTEEIKSISNIEEMIKDYKAGLLKEGELLGNVKEEAIYLKPFTRQRCESCGKRELREDMVAIFEENEGYYKFLCLSCDEKEL